GRVMVGYVDGCEGGPCKQAAPSAKGNAYTVTATIARQSSGRRLLETFDPPSTTEAPGMPSVTQRRIGRTVHLAWSEADTGNSPITSYQIPAAFLRIQRPFWPRFRALRSAAVLMT